LFDHRPYGSDLTLSDYHLFTYLKNWLESQRFNNNNEFMEGSSQVAADFFDTGIQQLIPQYDKCLNSSSDYVQKQLKHVCIFCI
jgi:hypothetical protein